jgi:hypothetical protein
MVAIDETQPLHPQGPFDAIMHKWTDVILAAKRGDAPSVQQIAELKQWEESNPGATLIDPIEQVTNLLHRGTVCNMVRECHVADGHGRTAEGPPFVMLEATTPDKPGALAAAGIVYPVLVKPIVAHGSVRGSMDAVDICVCARG